MGPLLATKSAGPGLSPLTLNWDFESIASDFLIFWTFIGHLFSAMSDRIYPSVKRFILKVIWAYFRSLFLRLPEQHYFQL